MKWINAETLGIQGKGFDTIGYRRLTEEDNEIMSKVFPQSVTNHHIVHFPKLGHCSSGLHIDFETNSRNIYVRWTVRYLDFSDSSSIINQSGMDLYILIDNKWKFAKGTIFLNKKTNECPLIDNFENLPKGNNKYTLNLSTYDEIVELEIGIDDDATIKGLEKKEDYIAIYGSSITQGGCASRPGMIYSNQIRLKMQEEVVNMGFCGLGVLNPEMIDILNKLNPKLMILDCVPNMRLMEKEDFQNRYYNFYNTFRKDHPKTPILFIEKAKYTNEWLISDTFSINNTYLKEVFNKLYETDKNLYYIEGDNLYGSSEASSDGEHPNDLGFTNMANIFITKIKEILNK